MKGSYWARREDAHLLLCRAESGGGASPARLTKAGSSPLAAWFRAGGGGSTADAIDVSRAASRSVSTPGVELAQTPTAERSRRSAQAAHSVDLSLLARLDGGWMGAAVEDSPVQPPKSLYHASARPLSASSAAQHARSTPWPLPN